MTQRQDRTGGVSGQVHMLCLRLADAVRLEILDTWANRRSLMSFLRCLRDADGRPLVTYEGIADQLG